jgi:hypothetical protein
MKIVWSWLDDSTNWIPYPEAISEKIEQGFQAKTKSMKKVPVDAVRHVNTVEMLQVRNDDPDKQVFFFVCTFDVRYFV